MRYVSSKYAMEVKENAYRIYISDSLFYQGQDKRLGVRYQELIEPKKAIEMDGDEIATDIIERLGLKVE